MAQTPIRKDCAVELREILGHWVIQTTSTVDLQSDSGSTHNRSMHCSPVTTKQLIMHWVAMEYFCLANCYANYYAKISDN